MKSSLTGLQEAAAVLDAMGAGRTPDPTDVLNAALILNTYCQRAEVTQDMLDAAAGLEIIATGGTLDLDEVGRRRATALAQVVRRAVP